MKTINELTKSLGISRQTLYNICKNEGLSIDSLTAEKRGNTRLFDDKAEETVKKLLSKRDRKAVNVKDTLDNLNRKLEEAEKRIRDQAEEIGKLTQDLDRANNRIDALIKTNMDLVTTKAQALPEGKKPGRIMKAWRALTGKAEGVTAYDR